MSRVLTAAETKMEILTLLDEVAAGDEVEITKRGHVVARLIPARGGHSLKGKFAGIAVTAAPEESLFTTTAT
jgi:prevent-host-death family protein